MPHGLQALIPLLFSALVAADPVPAMPELEAVATASAVNGTLYFQPGELLLAHPDLPGRPAILPIEGNKPVLLPSDLSEYDVLSTACPAAEASAQAPTTTDSPRSATDDVLARGDLGGDGRMEVVTASKPSALEPTTLTVFRGGTALARATLPMPARPCAGLVAEVVEDSPPDLLVVWSSRGSEGLTIGVSVFRLP